MDVDDTTYAPVVLLRQTPKSATLEVLIHAIGSHGRVCTDEAWGPRVETVDQGKLSAVITILTESGWEIEEIYQ
jgi:hypothetical protein